MHESDGVTNLKQEIDERDLFEIFFPILFPNMQIINKNWHVVDTL